MVDQQVQHVELVEELDVLLDAVLVERLQDHVAGAVRGVAGPAHGGLAVVAGVPAEAALVDPALGRAVERQAHLLQVEDRVDGLLGHDLGGVLVDQVVTALDGVERVPLPVVLLDVGQRGAHAALRRAGVGAGGVELGDHGGAAARRGLRAARMPAPPAPTMTTSYWWVCIGVDAFLCSWGRTCRASAVQNDGQQVRRRARRARVEREDHQRAEHDHDDEREVEQALERQPHAVALRVVVDDRPHAVGAVDHREPQHQQVPDLPERATPTCRRRRRSRSRRRPRRRPG